MKLVRRIGTISQIWHFGDLSDGISSIQQLKITSDLFRISSSYSGQAFHFKSNLIGATPCWLRYMASTSRFLKTDMVRVAVNNHSFRDSRFHVIDSVWESEIFAGCQNFTFMADMHCS